PVRLSRLAPSVPICTGGQAAGRGHGVQVFFGWILVGGAGRAVDMMQVVTGRQVFTSRLKGRPLLDSEGLAIGRIRDVVILPAGNEPPRALGMVVTVARRSIFVNFGRIAEVNVGGAHLRGGTVDLGRFTRRTGEILASELYGRHDGAGIIVDVAIARGEGRAGWE